MQPNVHDTYVVRTHRGSAGDAKSFEACNGRMSRHTFMRAGGIETHRWEQREAITGPAATPSTAEPGAESVDSV